MGAAYEHWFHQLSGNIRVRQNGKMADVPPLQEVVIDYPEIGPCVTYTVGHPEPLTLGLYHPSIHSSVNVMDFEASLIEMIRWIASQIDGKKMTVAEAAKYFMKIEHKSVPALLFSRIGPALFKGIWKQIRVRRKPLPLIFALASGIKNNKPTRAAASLTTMPLGGMEMENMGAATGVPLAVALALFAKGKIAQKGVFAPEGIIDPDDFFNELAPLCTPDFKNAKELVSVKIV
jgi:saccharopine dehydrogenase-like NADP-dependent oxidoreductase